MFWANVFGGLAFLLHILAYGMYAYHVHHERVKPNAATWSMWLVGGVIEWLTYDHMMGSHWSTSALPLACVLGLTLILCTTMWSQRRERKRGGSGTVYHRPDWKDWGLVSFDLVALAIWLVWDMAEEANIVAVVTTIATFIPIWRTTWREPESERPTMWLIWCVAYACMFISVLLRDTENMLWQSFYPIYFFALHAVVAVLAFRAFQQKQHGIPPMPAE